MGQALSRGDREKLATLDTALLKLETAEKQALLEINRAGFGFKTIREARAFQDRARLLVRTQAEAISDMTKHMRSKTR